MNYTLWQGKPQIAQNLIAEIYKLDKEKDWDVKIKEHAKGKSAEQLGLYWGFWIPAIQKWLEESKGVFLPNDDISEWLKDEYLDAHIIEIDGRVKQSRKSISRLKVKEMSEFMERVDRHCAERGLLLPEADPMRKAG